MTPGPGRPTTNPLRLLQRDSNLSPEGLRVLLEQRTGREVTEKQVARWTGGGPSKVPRFVREAFDFPSPVESAPRNGGGQPDELLELERELEEGFRLGDGAPQEPGLGTGSAPRPPQPERERSRELEPVVPDFDVRTVREVLVTAYQMVGKGAQYAARVRPDGTKPDYEKVFDAHAERCADAWIDLAKRDAKVAKVLVGLTAGGAWGQVILLHGSLVASLLVVSGKVNLPEGGLPMAPPPAPREPETAEHGSPHEPTPAV